jgi:hypothetical protein
MIGSRCRAALAALIAAAAAAAVAAASAAPALASGTPTVETKPATSIGETKATLNGIVNPNGAETKYYFDYGTSVFYGHKTAEVSAGSGTSNLEVSQAIKELIPFTSYHFRLVASNINGTTKGADQGFSTLEKPGLPEFVTPYPTTYHLTAGEVKIPEAGFLVIRCGGATGEGSITGAKRLVGKLALTECSLSSGEKCTSAGAKTGEIRSGELADRLAYDKTAPPVKETAIVFNYNGGTLMTFTCSGFPAREGVIRGGVIVPIKNPNHKTATVELILKTEGGTQAQTTYLNEIGEQVRCVPEISYVSSTFTESGFGVPIGASLNKFESGGKPVEIEVKT